MAPVLARPAPAAKQFIDEGRNPGAFPLVAAGRAAPLYVSESDWAGVLRALRDVQADLLRVTGREPQLLTDAPAAGRQPVVLVGTLGRSPLLSKLLQAGKFDAAQLRGRHEQFIIQAVEQPLPGVARALVVAGADERGTIYGLYELSRQAGVSPWHWWADAPVQPHRNLYVAAGRHTLGEPAIRYRGLNLAAASPTLTAWAKAHYGGLNADATERLVELLLRLRANCLVPATATDPAALALARAYGLLVLPPVQPGNHPPPTDSMFCPRLPNFTLPIPLPPPASTAQYWLADADNLKLQALPLSYFLDYAWHPAAAQAGGAAAYTRRWVSQQFGPAPAAAIAELLAPTDSLPTPTRREAVAAHNARLARAEALASHLPAADQAAYFELVVYPLACRAAHCELAYLAACQREALALGHTTRAAEQAAQARLVAAQAETRRQRYHALLGGKWNYLLPALTRPAAPASPIQAAETQAYGR